MKPMDELPDDDVTEPTVEDAAALTTLDRNSADVARRVCERLLPDPQVRRLVLELMAECVRRTANQPQGWGVTLTENEIGLNCGGRYVVVRILPRRVKLFFLPNGETERFEQTSPFSSLPEARRTLLAQEEIAVSLPVLRPAVLALTNEIAGTPRLLNGIWRRAHSPGVLRYIEEELGLKTPLPDPVYPTEQAEVSRQYWAIQANPTRYDIERAVRELDTDTWTTDNSKLRPGDRALIWKAKGSETHSGIVGLAEILEEATQIREKHPQYFRKPLTTEEQNKQRLLMRYLRSDKLPLWKNDLPPQLLDLTVAKGLQGNIFRVTQAQWNALMEYIGGWPDEQPISNMETKSDLPSLPLNQILFGPPGTGKTYNTILKSVELLTGVTHTTAKEAKPDWERLRNKERIEFVTFHQSYGYEDFIEGIRPVFEDEAEGTLRYAIHDGVLKRIVLRALAAMLVPVPVAAGEAGRVSFNLLWRKLQEEIEENPEKRYHGLTDRTNYRLRNVASESIAGENTANNDKYVSKTAPRGKVELVYERWRDSRTTIDTGDVQSVTQGSLQANLSAVLFRELKRIEVSCQNLPAELRATPPATEQQAETFLRTGKVDGYTFQPDDAPRFVLVMDEINRGNISKIFGELITLVEEDKRVGADVEIRATLPLSGLPFALPPNLYLVGTMNTADKSIALVDIALRRQFAFAEIRPNFAVFQNLPGKVRLVMEEMNRRITLRKDRDHQIGHALFKNVTSEAHFADVWECAVLPLLQEYFYNDWDGARAVLGESGETGKLICKLVAPDGFGSVRNRWQWHMDVGIGCAGVLDVLATNYGFAKDAAP